MPTNPTLLGTVQDVSGSTVSVALDQTTMSGLLFVAGHPYHVAQVGSFVRIPLGFTDLVGRYQVARSEGLVLRYLADAYKTLARTVPVTARTDELDDVIKEMLKTDKVTIVDVRVDQRENCFPMIPSGKAHNEMILSPDAEKFDKTLV